MRQPTTSARMLRARERRAFAVALRQTGASYETIARAAHRRFGSDLRTVYTSRDAHRDVADSMRALQKETDDAAHQVRLLEDARLDALQVTVWPRAVQGDLDAIATILKIMERRAKLWNLDGPVRIARTTPDGQPGAGTATGMTDAEFVAIMGLCQPYQCPERHDACT